MVVARLNTIVCSHRETNKPAACEGRGAKVPGVTAVRPEASRAIPGQTEADIQVRGRS
jgi:hypothetical protein